MDYHFPISTPRRPLSNRSELQPTFPFQQKESKLRSFMSGVASVTDIVCTSIMDAMVMQMAIEAFMFIPKMIYKGGKAFFNFVFDSE